jgi:ribose transport system permease protein
MTEVDAPASSLDLSGPIPGRRERGLRLAIQVVRVGPVLILLFALIVMALLSPVFLSTFNLQNLGIQAAIVALVATGQLLPILCKGVDLSVGSTIGLAAMTGVGVATHGASPPVVLLVMIGVGLVVGTTNATLLVAGRASPIVVTLATLGIARGVAYLISHGKSQFGMPEVVETIGTGLVGPIPIAVILAGVVAALFAVFTQLTQWGRWIYAVGAEPEAAKRAGIPVGKVLFSCYALCGVTAGVAAIVVVGQSGVAQPNAGQLMELDAITAVIIGGASFYGGRGSVGNVVVGALILAVIRNGLNVLSVDPFVQQVAIGTLILIAIQLDQLRIHLESRFRTTQALHAT